jgi:hypothetical protein
MGSAVKVLCCEDDEVGGPAAGVVNEGKDVAIVFGCVR